MAGKARQNPKEDGHTSPRGNGGRVPFKGYVNFSPNEKQKSLYRDAMENGYDYQEYLVDVCADGFDAKFGFDAYHSAFVATLYCKDKTSELAGWSLTARGRTPREAMSRVVFYHLFLLKGNWSVSRQTDEGDEQW